MTIEEQIREVARSEIVMKIVQAQTETRKIILDEMKKMILTEMAAVCRPIAAEAVREAMADRQKSPFSWDPEEKMEFDRAFFDFARTQAKRLDCSPVIIESRIRKILDYPGR